jgi:exodeoxyribonuclease V gamma subunit
MDDREPLELDELDKWKLGTALVEHLLSGRSLEQAEPLMRGAGLLPIGQSGRILLGELSEPCERVAARVKAERAGGSGESLDVRVRVGDVAIVGNVADRWPRAQVTYRYSKLSPKYEIETWLRHLAMCATPGESAPSVLVTRDESAPLRFRALDGAEASARLAELVALYAEGQERPLPFLPKTSHDYFERRDQSEAAALAAAAKAYDDNDRSEGRLDPHPARAFGDELPPFGDPEGFARIAQTVFRPLDEAKEVP